MEEGIKRNWISQWLALLFILLDSHMWLKPLKLSQTGLSNPLSCIFTSNRAVRPSRTDGELFLCVCSLLVLVSVLYNPAWTGGDGISPQIEFYTLSSLSIQWLRFTCRKTLAFVLLWASVISDLLQTSGSARCFAATQALLHLRKSLFSFLWQRDSVRLDALDLHRRNPRALTYMHSWSSCQNIAYRSPS